VSCLPAADGVPTRGRAVSRSTQLGILAFPEHPRREGRRSNSQVLISSSAERGQQSVATPQAARGCARRPCRHINIQP
jgi:hypothetical protein